jgi:hypothetical protein
MGVATFGPPQIAVKPEKDVLRLEENFFIVFR